MDILFSNKVVRRLLYIVKTIIIYYAKKKL